MIVAHFNANLSDLSTYRTQLMGIATLMIIICRITFAPDRLINVLFPPFLLLVVIRQLGGCIWEQGKATAIDSTLGWASLAIYIIAFICSFFGYSMAALLILEWWYFQLD